MGIIEEAIYKTYRLALQEGKLEKAKNATEMAKLLRQKVELEGFEDYPTEDGVYVPIIGNFFQPTPYRYYPDEGTLVIGNSAILLTESENKLFRYFSENESYAENVKIITKEEIKTFIWGHNGVSHNAVRIAVLRLRQKIEPDVTKPTIIINSYKKGYIFLAKRLQ